MAPRERRVLPPHLSIDKSTMTLISDDGYDIVVENYSLVGVTGPTMNISGADEDFNNLTDGTTVFSASSDFYSPIEITAGTNPDTVGVSGTLSSTHHLFSQLQLELKALTRRQILLWYRVVRA